MGPVAPMTNLFDVRDHLRLDIDFPDEELARKVLAAEAQAARYLHRRLFVDEASLAEARTSVPQALIDAGSAYSASLTEAQAITDLCARAEAVDYARAVYERALTGGRETRNGLVIDYDVEAAIMLIVGHLFENRQNVIATDGRAVVFELPQGAYSLLDPYRIALGV